MCKIISSQVCFQNFPFNIRQNEERRKEKICIQEYTVHACINKQAFILATFSKKWSSTGFSFKTHITTSLHNNNNYYYQISINECKLKNNHKKTIFIQRSLIEILYFFVFHVNSLLLLLSARVSLSSSSRSTSSFPPKPQF